MQVVDPSFHKDLKNIEQIGRASCYLCFENFATCVKGNLELKQTTKDS